MPDALPVIVDAHQDIAWNFFTNGRDFTKSAHSHRRREGNSQVAKRSGQAMIGAPNAILGRVAVICASIFVSPAWRALYADEPVVYATPQEAHDLGQRQVDYYHRLADESPVIRLIRTRADLDAILATWAPGRALSDHILGLVIGMEGADPILDPCQLEEWIECGLRLVGPAWSQTRYSGGTRALGPLTDLGRELLDCMAAHHLALDLAHMAPEACLEALDRYDGPIMASHANPLRFCPSRPDRNLSDDLIARIAEHDGVIGIMPYNLFLLEDWTSDRRKEAASLTTVVAAIDHVCQIAGSARHVGIGSDFDGGFGAEAAPAGLDTVSDLLTLAPALAERGYSPDDISAILSGNFLRLLRAALPE